MSENIFEKLREEVKKMFPEMQITENNDNVSVTGEHSIGVKGFHLSIECLASTIKIKCNRDYTYPISERSVEEFQDEMLKKHQGYGIYVNGQTLSFSKFYSYQSVDEALSGIKNAISVMEDAVLLFEDKCVNFLETHSDLNNDIEEYNPEENISLVNVDDKFHAVSMSEQDSLQYNKEHQEIAYQVFEDLAKKIGGVREGYEVEKTSSDNREVRCVLSEENSEILISVSIPADREVGAMYESYINANYPEIRASYDFEKERFSVRQYSSPDEYTPEATEECLKLCNAAVDACINEYKQMLTKKNSADFASDVQQILADQAASIEEREKKMTKKEAELNQYLEALKAKEQALNDKAEKLEQERSIIKDELESERKRIREKEQQMQEEIKQYEERNTRDILNIKELAGKVAALQNKQNALTDERDTDEEVFRLKSKVSQLTSQRIAIEKKLKESIHAKEEKIQQLSDVINEKDRVINEIEAGIDDAVKSRVYEESKKTATYISGLEKQLSEMGHILTPEDMIEFLHEYSDYEVKKFHAPNANFVVYNDEALEVRIRFGETNYVDVSREATLKDQIIRKLNTRYVDIKFFNGKDNRIVARSYFKANATAEEVDELIETLSSHFKSK